MRLERSRTDSRLFGLCGGLARCMGIGAGWIRLALVIGTLLTGGTLFFVYVIACMIIPKESPDSGYGQGHWYAPAYAGYGYGAVPGHASPAAPVDPAAVDAIMQQLEEQSLKRELQELRAKLERYEHQ